MNFEQSTEILRKCGSKPTREEQPATFEERTDKLRRVLHEDEPLVFDESLGELEAIQIREDVLNVCDEVDDLRRKLTSAESRIAQLRSQLDDAHKEIDRLDWLVKRETGVWLETRDANKQLRKEVENLAKVIFAGTNYIADSEQCPQTVWFANGRKVTIEHTPVKSEIEGGDAYLEITNEKHPSFGGSQ